MVIPHVVVVLGGVIPYIVVVVCQSVVNMTTSPLS